MPLDALFTQVLAAYPDVRKHQVFGTAAEFWPTLAAIRAAVGAVPVLSESKRVKLKVSFGQGNWAEVPNFAIMDTRETERPSAGLYVVYLVRPDGSGLVLSLNQGSADAIFEAKGRVNRLLAARADHVRASMNLTGLLAAGFDVAPVDLRATGQFPAAYAAGSIVSKTYLSEAMPPEAGLHEDLRVLWTAYQALIPSSRLRLAEVGRAPLSAARART